MGLVIIQILGAKNYTLVVYPDMAPEDWLEIMQQDMYDMHYFSLSR